MPYSSDAQRRFFHTDTAKKKGITEDEVNEFDKASKGKKLPEKKMAFGGETNPQHETVKSMENNPSAGFADGGDVAANANAIEPGVYGDTDPGNINAIINSLASGMATGQAAGAGVNAAMDLPSLLKALGEKGSIGPESIIPPSQQIEPFAKDLRQLWANVSNEQSGLTPRDYAAYVSPGNFKPHMAAGGDVMAALGQIANPFQGLGQATSNITGMVGDAMQNAPGLANMTFPGMGSTVAGPAQAAMNVAQSPAAQAALGPMGMPQTPQAPAPQPINPQSLPPAAQNMAPPVHQLSQQLQQTPSTNYDFYKNMSAEDRKALYDKLTQQQHGGKMLAAEGIGGLGDAIANSFGRGGAHSMQDIQASAQANKEGQLGAMDTERAQKMQDVQAKMAMMESDPNSAYSQGMRQFLKSQGMAVPSGMSAGMLKGLLPDVAKMFETKTQAATAAGAQGVDAGKALMGETLWDQFKESMGMGGNKTGEAYLENKVGGASAPSSSGWSVKH